jgi:hypothetical protein
LEEFGEFRIDLQFHFWKTGGCGLLDILQEMEKKDLDSLALLYYDWEENTSISPLTNKIGNEVKEKYEIGIFYRSSEVIKCRDRVVRNAVSFKNKKSGKSFLLFLGQEVEVRNQKWHVLSIGAYGIKPADSLEKAILEIENKGGIPILDHPFADPGWKFRDIRKEKEEELRAVCQKFKGKISLEWNGYSIPILRKLIPMPGYSDTNKKAEKLAKEIGIPLVPTTDLHCKKKKFLQLIGTSFIRIPAKDMDLNNPLRSLKENIFSNNFQGEKKPVPWKHFFEAYAFEALRKKVEK